jgi:uncharacterized protein (DUF697 family)
MAAFVSSAAVACGALALTAEPLAALAAIALQLRLVQRLAQARGTDPGPAETREHLLAAGIGLVSQYTEIIARQLLPAGGEALVAATDVFPQAAARFAFANAWVVGERTRLGPADDGFGHAHAEAGSGDLVRGAELFTRHAGAIEQQARRIDVAQLVRLVREW